MNEKIAAYDVKMTKTINNLDGELATIRAGRANPHVLDKVKVDYYGVATPVAQVGNVSVPEARTIMIQPWEPSLLKEIEKAILVSDIGITPTNDGKAIRLNFPDLTEERRKELCYEGQRWFDLRRYGMPSIQHKWEGKIYTLTKNDPSYVLPIPPNVLQRNLLLEQNPFGPERVGVSITN